MTTPRLRPYQVAGIAWLAARAAAILGDAMGLGKTVQYLLACLQVAPAGRFLILAPEATLPGLRAQISQWCPGAHVRTLARKSRDDRGTEPAEGEAPLFVLLGWTSAAARAADVLAMPQFNVVILDEAHRVKDPKAKVTRAVLGRWSRGASGAWERSPCIVSHAVRVWAATGTPVPNRPIEIQPLLHLGLGQSWAARARYGREFCERPNQFVPCGFDLLGAHNLPELNRRLRDGGLLLRRMPEDVPGELPALSVELVPLAGVREPVAAGLDLDTIRATLGERGTVPFAELAEYRARLGEEKAPAIAAWADEWLAENEGTALVLFFWHRAALSQAAEALRAAGHEVIEATGDDTPEVRQYKVNEFAHGAGRVFCGTIAACGTGLNGLHLRTTVCAFAEAPWTPGEVSQAIGRVRRLGSVGERTTAYLLAGEASLESHILQTIAEKLTVTETILADTAAPTPTPEPALPELPEPGLCPETGWGWGRLASGDWGLRLDANGCPAWAGARVTVRNRAGEEKRVTLGARVAYGSDWSLWTIKPMSEEERARGRRAWKLQAAGFGAPGSLAPEDEQAADAALAACRDLDGQDPDRGAVRNDAGWSAATRVWGRFLANLPRHEWSPAALAAARRVLAVHRNTQLSAAASAAVFSGKE